MKPANPPTYSRYSLGRRRFLALVSGGLLAAPLVAEAQQSEKVWRVGYLGNTPLTDPAVAGYFEALRQGLQEHGYVEGRNLVIERRFSAGVDARLPALASELIHLKVDILVTSGDPAAVAAKEATATIPMLLSRADEVIQ